MLAVIGGAGEIDRLARKINSKITGTMNENITGTRVVKALSREDKNLEEFQVLTNSYSAEFGKASGGVVNIVTKSGTNDFSGNAFYYFRDDALNARNPFTPEGKVAKILPGSRWSTDHLRSELEEVLTK